jgi:hypothetical protein
MEDSLRKYYSLVRKLENGLLCILVDFFITIVQNALSQGIILPPPNHARGDIGMEDGCLVFAL